ncbi:hypothetical protein AKJ52_01680 [candidate division MSBL1 archaeon SCGC-AAA382C18]|uniref:Uncharacterized protein n=1 Tax=candidate division MSBL1 archaeon SCGC-AAA382C18 TaxID=1698281 RepID=A0A133VJZ7_9EURY|nr:hypothetical protein AKJ52_01680 [candidate division MSBL1 archaeon SCGC-AAA382C18]
MFTKQMKATSLVTLTLIVGLLVTGVVGFADGRSPEEGIMEDTYIELLAPKVGLNSAELDEKMDEAMEQAAAEGERPISENYLEILASELNTDVDQLKTTMTETKVEAASKLEEEGTISTELADTFKERAANFPFGYQGANQGNGQRAAMANTDGSGNQYGPNDGSGTAAQPEDGSGYGPGNGAGNDGVCDEDGPHGRRADDDDQSRGRGRGRN